MKYVSLYFVKFFQFPVFKLGNDEVEKHSGLKIPT